MAFMHVACWGSTFDPIPAALRVAMVSILPPPAAGADACRVANGMAGQLQV